MFQLTNERDHNSEFVMIDTTNFIGQAMKPLLKTP